MKPKFIRELLARLNMKEKIIRAVCTGPMSGIKDSIEVLASSFEMNLYLHLEVMLRERARHLSNKDIDSFLDDIFRKQ